MEPLEKLDVVGISAMVVGRNEGDKLQNCLRSLSVLCNEILYADLDSNDNSIEVAEKFNCRVFKLKVFGPAGEHTHAELIKHVTNDWVIAIDPDEVIAEPLANQIISLLPKLDVDLQFGSVNVPWSFYFGTKRLSGTVWGFNKYKELIGNKKRYEYLPITHYGRRLKDGYRSYYVKPDGHNVLHHYWMTNLKSFVAKHRKYLKDEGKDRFTIGQRTSIPRIFASTFYQFYYCYVTCKGYRDGFTGLLLSFFWVWYSTNSNIGLLRIMQNARNNK